MASSGGGGGGSDRLSSLPIATLTRILSHLTTDEAVRTSAISRRWHRAFATVPVVHLVDKRCQKGYHETPVSFEQQVSSAMLSREPGASIRAFRVRTLNPSASLLDQWVLLAMSLGAEEVDVELQGWNSWNPKKLCPFGPVEGSSADFEQHIVLDSLPRRLFSAGSSLRCLRLTNCKLDLPRGDVSLGLLEELFLKRIIAPEGGVQRVLSACPRLADLTLEQCPSARETSVPSTRLRSFAIFCCHNATRVVLDTPCLRSLHYTGSLVDRSFFVLESWTGVKVVSIDICEDLDAGRTAARAATFTELIARCCTTLKSLHLCFRPSMAYYSRMFVSTLRWLHGLQQLELKGYLADNLTIQAVVDLLQSTRNLEQLNLFPLPPKPAKKQDYFSQRNSDDEEIDFSCKVNVPKGPWNARIKCLQRRLRRISVVNYSGRPLERTLVKLVLSKAKVLGELEVTFAAGCAAHQDELRREMSSWLLNQRIEVTFRQSKELRF